MPETKTAEKAPEPEKAKALKTVTSSDVGKQTATKASQKGK